MESKIANVPAGRPPLSSCKVCKRPVENRSVLSARGKCPECGHWLQEANIRQLVAHSGPFFHHWRNAMAASVGAVLVDDLADRD